ncbi:tRNA pseudouridine(55) synthase TruB [Mesoplasma syrphidae]|uniref:tRNA pseudouridine synthase B n=1 Tax=Mesoplasma syrphidae TaxID=225999 RepID=A0A2K9BSE4_9MOLU|nr:tRNA pseudouridine(55) synthase TruB [Mesoplasma syrphidae]
MNKSGVIIVNKPSGITTNGVIQKVKRSLGIKKVGHAGTLDPLATGVVICLVNNGTKVSDYLLNADKAYIVTMKLFVATDTYDSDGKILHTQVPFEISQSQIEAVVAKYDGLNYDQTPPIYSAIKVQGKKLYEYALDNREVEIQKRNITIQSLKLLGYDQIKQEITLEVKCSKGTYVRSLVVDFANDLQTIAHVTALQRTKSGSFTIDAAINMHDISEKDIIDLHTVLQNEQHSIVKTDNLKDVMLGKKIVLNTSDNLVFIEDEHHNILACYERDQNNVFKCRRGGLNN